MPERRNGEEDRRRTPRFSCVGQAKISYLPSNGIFLSGALRDLSLGGCCIDTTLPIDLGKQAELIVHVNSHVNAASFRAVGEVRAIRSGSAACVEFVHLSSIGKEMLADLISDLERAQMVLNKLRANRRRLHEEAFRKTLEERELQAVMLRQRFPFLGTILSAEDAVGDPEPDPAASASKDKDKNTNKDRIVKVSPVVIAVDLFG
jgi:hypothetical protein